MDSKLILACAAAVLAASCAARTQVEPVQPIVEPAEPQSASRQPAGPEVLAFQEYGRQIADRVSLDPHFGGFVFKHEPEPHAIVMFTGNAEARLRRYTRDPRFKAQRVDVTLAELEAWKEYTTGQMAGLRIECWTSDADEARNVVTVSTPEVEKVRTAIAEGRFKPPPKFRLERGSCVTWR